MIPRNEAASAAVVAFVAVVALPGTAHAYLDAGTGSMLLQVAIATFFALAYAVKTRWNRIRAWLSGNAAQETPPEPDDRTP